MRAFLVNYPAAKKMDYSASTASQDALRAYHSYLDHHAIREARRDFLGLIQRMHADNKFGKYLMIASKRMPQCFPMYKKTVGSAWQA